MSVLCPQIFGPLTDDRLSIVEWVRRFLAEPSQYHCPPAALQVGAWLPRDHTIGTLAEIVGIRWLDVDCAARWGYDHPRYECNGEIVARLLRERGFDVLSFSSTRGQATLEQEVLFGQELASSLALTLVDRVYVVPPESWNAVASTSVKQRIEAEISAREREFTSQ